MNSSRRGDRQVPVCLIGYPSSQANFSNLALAVCAIAVAFSLAFQQTEGAVPVDLSNDQGSFQCPEDVLIVRPATVDDIAEAVQNSAAIQSNGDGHSWNDHFFCANPNAATARRQSANIQLRTVRPLRIEVDELHMFVDVSAGVRLADLFDYLAAYKTPLSPNGYALGSVPVWWNQTVGGSVATGTHGSNIRGFNSLSDQVVEFTIIDRKGEKVVINEDDDPFLMRAMRISVGRLGVIVSLKLRIVPNDPVTRELQFTKVSVLLDQVSQIQEQFRVQGTLPDFANERQWYWGVNQKLISQISLNAAYEFPEVPDLKKCRKDDGSFDCIETLLKRLSDNQDKYYLNDKQQDMDHDLAEVELCKKLVLLLAMSNEDVVAELEEILRLINADLEVPDADSQGPDGQEWGPVVRNERMDYPFPPSVEGQKGYFNALAFNTTDLARNTFIVFDPNSGPVADINDIIFQRILNTQYEFAIPIDKASDCLAGLVDLTYIGSDPDGLEEPDREFGYRISIVIRILGKEKALLSVSNDKPVLWIDLTDYIAPNDESCTTTNPLFQDAVKFLRTSELCTGARLHWGKAGFPEPGCFEGAKEFPDTWCDFGCAIRKLDPHNKFDDQSMLWNYEGVDLERCCDEHGFKHYKKGCVCNPKPQRSDSCPPPPGFTVPLNDYDYDC